MTGRKPAHDSYDRLIALLDLRGASYRLIDHPPEGRTEIVSAMREHAVGAAAKCIVVMVKLGKKVTKFVLAVVPGDMRVDLGAIRALNCATYAGFAPPEKAEELSGSVMGAVLPFAFDDRLELIADDRLQVHPELFFNAARLDRSLALASADYVRIARPRFERIALPNSLGS